jgi:hypothetical protein
MELNPERALAWRMRRYLLAGWIEAVTGAALTVAIQ